jgi:predicted RNase H-like nuclease (RuvC/YqgF family)
MTVLKGTAPNDELESVIRALKCQVKELEERVQWGQTELSIREINLRTLANKNEEYLEEIRRLQSENQHLAVTMVMDLIREITTTLEKSAQFCRSTAMHHLLNRKLNDLDNKKLQLSPLEEEMSLWKD